MLEIVNQLDGFDSRGNIKVLMATNRPDTLDPALLRPGRLDRKVAFMLANCSHSSIADHSRVFSCCNCKQICCGRHFSIRNACRALLQANLCTQVEFGLPDLESRAQIFQIHTRTMNCERDIRFELLARLCPNSTGADIRSVCTEAGMFAIRARRKTVTEKDFLESVNKVRLKGVRCCSALTWTCALLNLLVELAA